MKVFKKLWLYIAKYKLILFLGILFVVFHVIGSMVPGFISRIIIDDVIVAGDIDLLPKLLLFLISATLFRSIFALAHRYFVEKLSQNVLRDLKQSVYDHLQKMSYNYFNQNKTGELMSRMTGDMQAIRRFLAEGPIQITQCIFYLLFVTIVLIRENIPLTIISLATSPFIAFFAYRLSTRIKPAFSNVRKQYSDLNSTVQENISGIKVVKAFHQRSFELDKFITENNDYFRKNYKTAKIWAKYFPIIELLGSASTVLLLYFGGRLVIQGDITLGVWMLFNSYLWMLIMPMRMLGHLVNMTSRAVASGERIFEILATEPEIEDKDDAIVMNSIIGDLRFDNVSLNYGGEEILKNINLDVKAGQTVAIMGATGSGKTSLVNLIGRYYQASEGEIYIDGINIKDIAVKSLRRQVSVVMQDVFLFSETVAKNIAYSNPDIDLAKIKNAADIAEAKEFIEEMEEGFQTVIGERGMGLSGGQKQRVSIARAIIEKASIMILDDATSAVDMETEHKIQESLDNLDYDITQFIIAHRISSVRNADKIVLLEEGEIVEQGTHEELLDKKGRYFEIFKLQYQGVLEEESFKNEWVMS